MRKWWSRIGNREPEVKKESGFSSLHEARPRLMAELRRARRHERPLTLLTLAPEWVGRPEAARRRRQLAENGTEARNGNGEGENGMFPASSLHSDLLFVGMLLRGALRETDLIALSVEDPGYAVLLPETAVSQSRAAAERLRRVICERMSLSLRIGAAAFPHDGLTIEDLIGNSRHAWHHRPFLESPSASEASSE